MKLELEFRIEPDFRYSESRFALTLESRNVEAHSRMTDFSPSLNNLIREALDANKRHIEYLIRQELYGSDPN